MGARFRSEQSNLIAYLSAAGDTEPPRISYPDLGDFLQGLPESFYSPDAALRKHISDLAADAGQQLDLDGRRHRADPFVAPAYLENLLQPFREILANLHLFALAVGAGEDHHGRKQLDAFAADLANSIPGRGLVLLPAEGISAPLTVLDPFPAFALAMERSQDWPGMLFWTHSGAAAFAPLAQARDLGPRLVAALHRDSSAEVEHLLRTFEPAAPTRRILHLSDLHFGSKWALRNEALLSGHLHEVVKNVDRLVITGDLFDNPTDREELTFNNFRQSLRRITPKDPVLIPGNHDQRRKGNRLPGLLGRVTRQLPKQSFCTVCVDDDLGCAFLGFDSSESGSFARGRVTPAQLTRVAAEYQNSLVQRPEIKGYQKIALVHHHPFSFKTPAQTLVQRTLALVGLNDESFLRMEHAGEFVTWCARWSIPLILHGHKHVPRHVTTTVRPAGLPPQQISAIGCGSSLGAEGSPLSYNILSFDQRHRRWIASFYSSEAGGPFVRQLVSIQSVPPPSP